MKNKMLWVVLGLCIGACCFLFFAIFESYKKEIDTGWSREARLNPYLAAQKYLQAQGVATESLDTLGEGVDLGMVDTLYIEDSRAVLSRRQVDLLLGWVNGGGHLIVVAGLNTDDNRDPILDALQLTVERSECDCDDQEDDLQEAQVEASSKLESPEQGQTEADSEPKKPYTPISDWLRNKHDDNSGEKAEPDKPKVDPSKLTELRFNGVDEKLTAHLNTYWVLNHPYLYVEEGEEYEGVKPIYWGGTKWGIHFMQFEMGSGLLTVLNDDEVWTSSKIDQYDHAYLLSVLTDHSRQLYFLKRNQMPSLFVLLWQHAQEVVVAFITWLSLWLLYRGRRFLPSQTITKVSRRSVMEHIQAVGYFYWQRRAFDKLLATQREEILKYARYQVPSYLSLTATEQMQALAKHCDLPFETVIFAMNSKVISGEDQFVAVVQTLKTIKSGLWRI